MLMNVYIMLNIFYRHSIKNDVRTELKRVPFLARVCVRVRSMYLMCILRTECAPSFYSWVRVIKGALTPEVKTLAHWPTYEVIYRPTMTRLGPTYNQPIQCNPWWCNPDNNTCLANCPCYCFGRQPMKNLLTNDVMLTTTRVWLKITSPQNRR